MDTIYYSINKLYDKAGYLDRYGGDLYIAIIVFSLFFLVFSYYAVMTRLRPIRANWVKERCNPSVVPFAGLIYRPKGKSVMQATADNFAECGQTVTRNIASYALQPLLYVITTMNTMFAEMANSVNAARGMFNHVRGGVTEVGQDVMGKSLNIMSPIQNVMASSKAAFGKASGIGASAIYTLYGSYLALKAMIGSIIQFIIVILVALAALILVMWLMPWTWPIAAAGTAVFIVMAAMLAYLAIVFSKAMGGRTRGKIPKKP
jgi:hypothetical protein